MSFKGFSIFSFGGLFQWSETILAILVEGHPRNISVKFFLKSGHWPRRCRLKVFLFLALMAILFSSETSLAILIEGHPKHISVKLF